jgi:hypothetical protein
VPEIPGAVANFVRLSTPSRSRRSPATGHRLKFTARGLSVVLLAALILGGPVSPAFANGETWTPIPAAENNTWTSVAYGNGVWIAVAAAVTAPGTNRVMRSTDQGMTWSPVATAAALAWSSVAYGDGVWVAVANGGTGTRVMRSTDNGLTWNATGVSGVDNLTTWQSVANGDRVWVAVARSGTDRVMRSTDGGLTWTAVTMAASTWTSVAYGDGEWVAVANVGTDLVMRSTDRGLNWTSAGVSGVELNDWRLVTYGDGVWVAVARSGTNRVMRSTDGGLAWTPILVPEANSWESVAYGDGVWIAVATSGTNRVMRSTDKGATWTPILAAEENSWQSVAHGDRVWVAVAYSGTNRVMRSFTISSATESSSSTTERSVSNPAIHLDLQARLGQQGANAPVLMEGEGLRPGTAYSLALQEPLRIIQSGSASTGGRFSHLVNVPSDLKPGSYRITLTAIGTSGESLVLVQSFRIGADGSFAYIGSAVPTFKGGLAQTGPDSAEALGGFAFALLATLVGVALAVTSRRRVKPL